MTQEQLNKIIENHQHYLNKDVDKWENMRADLSYENLSCLDLKNANLREADLYRAFCYYTNLCGADLRNADLREANMFGANLSDATLIEANLSRAYLLDTDLSHANLRNADLRDADLRNANLRNANMYRACCCDTNLNGVDLRSADLSDADISIADLRDANLLGTNLKNANISYVEINENTKIDYPIACPETGSFIGYKKANEKIVKLQICEDAKRSSAIGKKCRCSKALVLAIESIDGSDSGLQEIKSDFDSSFIYRVGKIAEVPDFNDNRWDECTSGIHFFMDRQDAVEYEL
jgi:uncharacterized protein YjbI with pentapeptide repeats